MCIRDSYVAKNKIQMLTSQANIFNRGVKNLNSNKKVSKYYVNQYDVPNAQADLMRPIYNGKGENKNFYPEAYIIPLDKKHQRNIQDAAEMLKWLARNDIKAQLSKKAFTYKGVKYPKGTIVVPMYQAKRSLANANLSGGSYVTVWKGLYSEAFSQHPYARGFDIITVTKKADYKKIIKTCDKAMTYKGAQMCIRDRSLPAPRYAAGAARAFHAEAHSDRHRTSRQTPADRCFPDAGFY